MNKEQRAVREFHKTFDRPINDNPTLLDYDKAIFRTKLIGEELCELQDAIDEQNIVKIADALGDLLYVVYGSGVSFGIDLEAVFDEIHRSNMTKIGATIREDGKVIKPDTYTPPDLEKVLFGKKKFKGAGTVVKPKESTDEERMVDTMVGAIDNLRESIDNLRKALAVQPKPPTKKISECCNGMVIMKGRSSLTYCNECGNHCKTLEILL